jgi:hypothetical protein
MQGSSALGPGGEAGPGGPGSEAGPGGETGPGGPGSGAHTRPERRGPDRKRRAQILAVAAVAAVVLILAVAAIIADPLGDADELTVPVDPTTTAPTTSPVSTTSTTAVPSSSTTVPPSTTTTAVPSTVTTLPPEVPDGGTTTVPPVGDPPVIGGFRIVNENKPCQGGAFHSATWSTTNATAATIGVVGGPATEVAPTGTTTLCAPAGVTFELVATGPGGKASATAAAPIIIVE